MYDLAFFAYPALIGVVLSIVAVAVSELGPLASARSIVTVRSAETKAKAAKKSPLKTTGLAPCATC
jgi:hypothetical protein